MSEAPGAPTAPAPEVGAVARIPGALFSPAKTFESIARKPTWLAPMLLWVLVSLAASIVLAPRLDTQKLVRRLLERRGMNVGDDQIAAMAASRRPGLAGTLGRALVAPPIAALAVTVVIWGALRAFGWEASFQQAFGATAHGFLPSVLKSLLVIPIASQHESIDPWSVGDLVRSNPGFAMADRSPAVHLLAQSFDVFSFWTMALLAIGFSAAAKVKPGAAAAVIVTLWALLVGGLAGVSAFFF